MKLNPTFYIYVKKGIVPLYSLLLVSIFLGCSKETEMEQDVVDFTPSFTLSTPVEDQEVPDVTIEKVQIVPEYPEVSSFLEAWGEESYHGYNTMDGDETTAWVESAYGLGAGEWLTHYFGWEQFIQEITFYNGHGGNEKEFGVARKIQLSFSTGEEYSYNVESGWNTIVLKQPIPTTYVQLTILEGKGTVREDVAISEMKCYNVSTESPTTILSKDEILKNMGALGDCSNITSEQAAAFASELQKIIAWAEVTAAERAYMGTGYDNYTGEALLFSGGNGVPVLYYDYDFTKVDELFVTKTDVVVWEDGVAKSAYFETMGEDTTINWILPGYVYENDGAYYFGLTEVDLYGSGSFGLIAMVGFDGGIPRSRANYLAFLSHHSRGSYTYYQELTDYMKMPVLSSFPMYELAELITAGQEDYFEYSGVAFFKKNLVYDPADYSTWYAAIRGARLDEGYQQVTRVQSGETVLAGLLALS